MFASTLTVDKGESKKEVKIARFVKTEEEFQEQLLRKMMNVVSRKCPETDFKIMISKLRIPKEDIENITSNPTIEKPEILVMLFKIWRLRQNLPAIETQDKFVHVVDLVDQPKLTSALRAIRIYSKAIRL